VKLSFKSKREILSKPSRNAGNLLVLKGLVKCVRSSLERRKEVWVRKSAPYKQRKNIREEISEGKMKHFLNSSLI
jgi:hypothetical protein